MSSKVIRHGYERRQNSITDYVEVPCLLAYELDDANLTCTITGIGTNTDSNIVIPKTVEGHRVTLR